MPKLVQNELPPSVQARNARRLELCDRFVREHHPGMVDVSSRFKGARELMPLPAVRRIRSLDSDWWYQTDESICALGGTYVGRLFDNCDLLDHDWMIGRSEQEPWALVSEPYRSPVNVPKLRQDLEAVGVELLEYASALATHNPDGSLVLVANIIDGHRLAAAVARLIVDAYEPPRVSDKASRQHI